MVRPVRWLCFPVGCVAAVAMIAPPAPTAGTGLGGEDDDSRFLSIDSLDEARELEARLRAGADRARAASVIIIIRGDRQTPGATGSGTIISSDGWIVTAGHVGDEAGRPCEVRLEDGTKLQGMTAGMVFQGVRDWGLLKVDPKGQSLPFVSMVDPEPLPRGSWLCVHGHTYGPELDAWTPPALRIGRVLAQNEMAMLVDAPFASGDSGGGVFTIDGDLIGIVSSAGELVWQSTATSLRPVLPDLDRLKAELPAGAFATMPAETAVEAAAQSQDGDEGGTVPASTMPQQESPEEESTSPAPGSADAVPPNGQDPSDERPRRGRRRGPQFDRSDENVDAYTRESRSLLRALSPAVEGVSTSIAVIYVDHLPVVLGTVIDPDGTILTKRSELPEDGEGIMVTMPDGLMVSGTVVAVRHDEDLALVSTGEGEQDAINFLVPLADASLDEGEIILSPGPDGMPKAMGVIALRDRTTTRRDVTSAFLGVGVRESTKQELASAGVSQAVTIWTLTRGSPAEACGLKQGDLLVSVDGTAIPSQVVLGEVVRRHAVGEAMKISLVRDGKPMECVIRGAVRSRESGPPASTTDAPASRRPSGFGSVIQHDSVMGSSEMGGPLVDLDGRVLGLNIARVDRTRTYALSRERVAQAIKGMRDDIAAGKDPIQPTALMVALEVHVEGETSLNAAAAQPRGGQLLYATPERGTEGSVAGFATPGDTLSWRVVVPEAMRVQIDLRYSLPGDRQGPDERVAVEVKDGDSTEAPLRKTVRGRYVRKLIGDLNLPAGESTIQLRVLDAPATLSVRSLILTPVQSAVPEAPKEE